MNKEFKTQLDQMHKLMEHMDKHYSSDQKTMLNESIEELDANNREDVDVKDFFDMISSMKGGLRSTIGYVSAVSLNLPQIKKKNPETNRMKSYPDWDEFGKQLNETTPISGVIKFASYNLNWRTPENMRRHYNKNYVDVVNKKRDEYGVPHMERRKPYTQTLDFGNGISAYNGDNAALQGHSYSPQDIALAKSDIKYYLIGTDGNIVREVSYAELKPFLKSRGVDGIKAFRELQKSDEEFKRYAAEIAKIDFRYIQFEHSSVVFVITSINGQKKRFFNKNLTNAVKGININPQEILALAKQKYNIAQQDEKNQTFGETPDEFEGIPEEL